MVTGIRQGSVESPQMFAAVVDWILTDLRQEQGWDEHQVFEGIRIGEIAFVDDLIVWETSNARPVRSPMPCPNGA